MRDSLEGFEAPYEPADWLDLESRLDQQVAPPKASSSLGKSALYGLAGAVVLAGAFFLINPEEEPTDISTNAPAVAAVTETTIPTETEGSATQPAPVQMQNATDIGAEPAQNEPQENQQLPAASVGQDVAASTVADQGQEQDETKTDQVTTADKSDQTTASQTPRQDDVMQEMHIGFSTDRNNYCLGEATQFYAEEPRVPASFVWNFGDGTSSTDPNPVHRYAEPGLYSVSLELRSDLDDSVLEKVKQNHVRILPRPNPHVLNPVRADHAEYLDYYDPSFVFEAEQGGYTNWEWHLDGKHVSTELRPKFTYQKKGTYEVMFISQNDAGCRDTVVQQVVVQQDYNLLAPNSFSPNLLDGTNDTWFPVALRTDKYDEFELRIVDANNRLVFFSNDARKEWDGRKQASRDYANRGEQYFWKARVREDKEIKDYQGSILILR